jgi:tRNA (mo5U34)-methyltransferase
VANAMDSTPGLVRQNSSQNWPRRALRSFIHFFSYHLILKRKTTRWTRAAGFRLVVRPTVFHPRFFVTSNFFARFIGRLDLTGKSVLDIGCNAGFYSIEMKRRGAERVVAIDFDADYLNKARFAAAVTGVDLEFSELSVYDVGTLGERFDIVLFLGILYHLRHPLLALDLIHEHVAGDLLVFQSMQRGSTEIEPLEEDYAFTEIEVFDRPGFPKLHFIESRYAGDPTNWWAPNRACSEALLRSAGFAVVARPEEEVFICRRQELPGGSQAVYPRTAEERCSKR